MLYSRLRAIPTYFPDSETPECTRQQVTELKSINHLKTRLKINACLLLLVFISELRTTTLPVTHPVCHFTFTACLVYVSTLCTVGSCFCVCRYGFFPVFLLHCFSLDGQSAQSSLWFIVFFVLVGLYRHFYRSLLTRLLQFTVLSSSTVSDKKRLQNIQNSLARDVTRTPKSSHITPVLKSLHSEP